MLGSGSFQVAGVDGCKGGWVVANVVVTPDCTGQHHDYIYVLNNFWVISDFAEVLHRMEHCRMVCVDIPIGLTDGPARDCDLRARKLLGQPRGTSVFPAPVRPCLRARTYEEAKEISRKYSGKGLSKQSFELIDKIRQVDDVMTPELQQRVRELHPEISFWALNGQEAVVDSKAGPAGQMRRIELLLTVFSEIADVLAKSDLSGAKLDDLLDALVAAWTAGQAIATKIETLPEGPELDSKGLKMEILRPDRHV